jgi:hypothetical protein
MKKRHTFASTLLTTDVVRACDRHAVLASACVDASATASQIRCSVNTLVIA